MAVSEIRLENLEWKPARRKEPVLKNVSAVFRQGEIYGILGANGAGKTSLVRHIMGLLPHTTGTVLLDGEPLEKYERQELAKNIAFLPQRIAPEADFTVYDVVSMSREPYRKPFAALTRLDCEKINEALALTETEHFADAHISTLSGGELQRVMIARAIAQDTPWIILDEPISSLDIKQQTSFMALVQKLHDENDKTIITILHDLNLAAEFCTQLILMKNGEIISSGLPENVLTQENLQRAFDVAFQFLPVPDREMAYMRATMTEKQV